MIFLYCCSKATGSFSIPTLYDKNIKNGSERQNFEEPALPLAVGEGMSTKWGGRTGLAMTDSVTISLHSHRLSGVLNIEATFLLHCSFLHCGGFP